MIRGIKSGSYFLCRCPLGKSQRSFQENGKSLGQAVGHWSVLCKIERYSEGPFIDGRLSEWSVCD